MKVAYIAGAYRGPNAWEIEKNIRRAEEIALEVWGLGAAAVCPHLNTAHFQGALPDETWLLGDLAILERCDAIVMVPGWKDSVGASAEHVHALDRAMPCFEWPADKEKIAEWTR